MQYFTMSGELLRVVGEPGRAPGQLWWPIGVALRGGLAFVSEARNNRVQVFGQSDGVAAQRARTLHAPARVHAGGWGFCRDERHDDVAHHH